MNVYSVLEFLSCVLDQLFSERQLFDMILIVLVVFSSQVSLYSSLLDDSYSSNIVTSPPRFSIGVVYNPHFKLQSYHDLAGSLREVVRYYQEAWQATISFKFIQFAEFEPKSSFTAVVSVLSCEETWGIYRKADDSGLLVISVTENVCPRLPPVDGVTVPLSLPGSELPQLLLDLRSSQLITWPSVAIICDHTIDGEVIETLVHAMTTELMDNEFIVKSSSALLYMIEPAESDWERRTNVLDLMSNMPKLEENSNFLVVVGFDLIGVILDVIKQLNLMKPTCQWLFVLPVKPKHKNLHEFGVHLIEGGNVAFLYNNSVDRPRCLDGLECELGSLVQSLADGLDLAAQTEYDKSKQVSEEEWEQIKPTRTERKTSLLQFIDRRLRTDGRCNNCSHWGAFTAELWGQEYVSDGVTRHLLPLGLWTPRLGYIFSDQLFPHIKYGFRLLNLPIASVHSPPWQIIKYNSSGYPAEFSGVVFEILNSIAEKLNFTYNVVIPTNSSSTAGVGVSESNNTATSDRYNNNLMQDNSIQDKMYNLVMNKKVFMGACALTITNNKENIITFSEPVSIESYVFLVSRPKELSRALLFILPFTSDAWLCIIGSILIMSPTLYIVHLLSPYYDYFGVSKRTGLGKLSNCFWYVYGALLQQGGAHLPLADSGRIVIGTWWIVVLVIVTTYCGNLVAFLTFPKMDKLITNLYDLQARKDLLTWGIPDSAFVKTLLMSVEESVVREVLNLAHLHREVTPAVVDSVRSGQHAFIQTKTQLLYLLKDQYRATNTCDFSLGNEEFIQEKLGMILSVFNPYTELINNEIKLMHRVGLIHKWVQDYSPLRDRCWSTMHSTEVTNHTVNLNDMQGSFFVLFLGMCISFLIIIVELCVKKRMLAKEQHIIQPFIQ